MKLLSLKMNNFMAYKGAHEINFDVSEHSPIILFLGENGHGKSSIQHAARWCLYGETSSRNHVIENSKLLNRKSVLESSASHPEKISVAISWSDSGKNFELIRNWSWDVTGNSPSHAILRIDGGNPVPETSIPEYVQRFLAKEISHFFFFDGEVQKEFDEMVTDSRSANFIRSEIEKTLSIPVITSGIKWLVDKKTIENRAIVKANKDDEKVSKASKQLDEKTELLNKTNDEKVKTQERLSIVIDHLNALDDEVKNIEAAQSIHSEMTGIEATKKQKEQEYRDKKSEICDVLSEYPWLPASDELIKILRTNAAALSEATNISSQLIRLQNESSQLELLKSEKTCPLCESKHDSTPESINLKIDLIREKLSGLALPDVDTLTRNKTLIVSANLQQEIHVKARNLKKEYEALGSEVEKLSRNYEGKKQDLRLLGDVDIVTALNKSKTLTKDKTSFEDAIRNYTREADELTRDISKLMAEISKTVGVSPEIKIAHSSYSYLATLFEQAKATYTKAVKSNVEHFASETFMKTISDSKFTGLRINDNYGVDLVMRDGEVDPLASTGQGKVATLSLISGLIKTSMPEGFVLMDTPFVSLDQGHRRQVCLWAAHSGLHVSLFMHSGEFSKEQIGQFDGKVGRIYRIKQIAENESTISEEVE